MRKQLLISISILAFLLITTAVVISYGQGYQFDFIKGKPEFLGTGMLVATSMPDGAQVYIDGHLTTATNNTINLPPRTYQIKIYKEGYFPWTKTIMIQKEVVSKADALLLPVAPKLESITAFGATNPVLDPSGTKIAFNVSSQSADTNKNGIYLLNMNTTPLLTLQSSSMQIVDERAAPFSSSALSWTPDGQSIIATISAQNNATTYLLASSSFNSVPKDITTTLPDLIDGWKKDRLDRTVAQVSGLRQDLKDLVKANFMVLAWSADETKILYTASTSAVLPQIIKPSLIGTDSTPEVRNITEGNIYVYDIKEDKNFLIADKSIVTGNIQQFSWLYDSKHLLFVSDKKIEVMDYDGSNKTIVYAGPFVDTYVFPWPNGPKFVILTNLGNTDTPPNLYTVSLQ